jgi:putative methyltransferase (TIGR04325 family)
MPYKIFSGVYKLFSETGITDNIFTSERYLSNMKNKIDIELSASTEIAYGYQAIPILSGVFLSESFKKPFRILDFGGGAGINYLRLIKALKFRYEFEYHIFDSEAVINVARKYIKAPIVFESEFDNLLGSYDFIVIQSVLQYIERLDELLPLLTSKNPRHILLEDTFLSKTGEFVTMADYYGLKHPFKVHNYPNLCEMLLKLGYKLVYECPQIMPVQGNFTFYDMTNLPIAEQLQHSYSLIFTKNC